MHPDAFVGKVAWTQPPDLKVSFPPLIRNSPVFAPVPLAAHPLDEQLIVRDAFEQVPDPVQ